MKRERAGKGAMAASHAACRKKALGGKHARRQLLGLLCRVRFG
jgi:hypothetical protein